MLRRALPILALLAVACAPDRTAILVEVTSSDLAAPDDVDGLRFTAVSEYGGRVDQSFPISSTWPQSLTIVPPEGERMGRITITVTGSRGGAFVVRRVVAAEFQPGTTRRVSVDLPASCRGVMCAEGVDCRGGSCDGISGDAGVDGGPADAGEDAQVVEDDAGLDASIEDGGPADGGGVDGGPADGGPRDAGPADAGPRDAGTDARAPDAGPPPASTLLITEVDYDQNGTDTTEFVEIRNVSSGTIDLAGYTLFLVNGSSTPATTYTMIALDGSLTAGQRVVVGAAAVTVPAGVRHIVLGSAIQNGDPDGVALWNEGTLTLADSLSYGGAITMATIAGRTVSLVDGTATTARDSTTAVRSVCRFPDAADTGNDSVDWVECATPTPGATNVR